MTLGLALLLAAAVSTTLVLAVVVSLVRRAVAGTAGRS